MLANAGRGRSTARYRMSFTSPELMRCVTAGQYALFVLQTLERSPQQDKERPLGNDKEDEESNECWRRHGVEPRHHLEGAQCERQRNDPDDRGSDEPGEDYRRIEKSTETVHGCARMKCNDRASPHFLQVHVKAHQLVQTSPRTQLLVTRAEPRRIGCDRKSRIAHRSNMSTA